MPSPALCNSERQSRRELPLFRPPTGSGPQSRAVWGEFQHKRMLVSEAVSQVQR